MNSNELFCRFDNEETPIEDLQFLNFLLINLKDSGLYIKWIIISFHNILQEFMILALRGTSNILITKENSITDREKVGKTHDFLELYDRIKKIKYMKHYDNSKAYVPQERVTVSVKYLNDIRNDLIHFLLSAISIEKNQLIFCFQDIVSVIKFLVNESGNINYENEKLMIINDLLKEIENTIKEI